jgi:hypothetical protein
MIDTQRLGALLRAWIREDALLERQRALPVAALRPLGAVGSEVADLERSGVVATAAAATAPLRDGAMTANGKAPASAEDGHDAHGPAARLPAPAASSGPAPAAGAPATVAAAVGSAPTDPAASAQLALSPAGRLLLAALGAGAANAHLLASPLNRDHANAAPGDGPGERAGVVSARPLVAVPPHSEYATDRLALQLKDTVEYSGVFYESHLAQWADDRRPRALLGREPQAAWTAGSGASDGAAPATADPASSALARPLLAEQLAVLDSGRFQWQGELWPGQRAALTIEEERDSRDPRDARQPVAPRWRLALSLDFAGLGPVAVELHLCAEDVDVALACRGDTATLLAQATPQLREALAGRALALHSLAVNDGLRS